MWTANALRERIAALLAEALTVDAPTFDTDLFETGVLDSLAFVELLVRLEQEFGVAPSVEDLEVDNFRSIRRIADFVAARTSMATGTGSFCADVPHFLQ